MRAPSINISAPAHGSTTVLAKKPSTRVLIVMPLAEQRGGGELMMLHLVEHGRNLGIDWCVAFFDDGPMVELVRDWNVPTFMISAGRLRQLHRVWQSIRKLRRLIREQRIDYVLSWMGKAQMYGGAAAALEGIPAVWYQLGLPDPPSWQDRVATLLPTHAVLTCSDTATAAQAKVKPHRRTLTVHPGVDLTRFNAQSLPTPAECRRRLGLPSTGPLIGIVGRLQRWKGMHHLIDAMPAILKKFPDAHAVIVGGTHSFEPEYPVYLNKQIASLGLEKQVILAGLQSNVPEWMLAMDVIVHASDSEPFGIVVIEAMALGKPVIATNTAGPSEIVTDGVNGFLWPAGDVEQLRDRIEKCLESSVLCKSISAAAARRARDFGVERYVEKVVDSITSPRH